MNKLIGIIACIILTASIAVSSTIDVIGTSKEVGNRDKEYTYALNTPVTLDNGTMVFKINTPEYNGKIIAISITSTSPDCDFWLSEKDNSTKKSIYTRIKMSSVDADGSTPVISGVVPFHNEDTPYDDYLYLMADNLSATDLDNTTALKITFKNRRD